MIAKYSLSFLACYFIPAFSFDLGFLSFHNTVMVYCSSLIIVSFCYMFSKNSPVV